MQLMSLDAVPDALIPYTGRLTPRFYEVRKQVLGFILEVPVVDDRSALHMYMYHD